jgi:hypothetical protein
MSIQKANKNEVRKEIAALIDRIKEQSDRIGTQREIPQSELDVILHRIEELHRRTVVWSYLNTLPEEVQSEKEWVDNLISEKEPEVVTVPVVEPEVEQLPPTPEPKVIPLMPRVDVSKEEPLAKQESVDKDETVQPIVEKVPVELPKTEPVPPVAPTLKDIRSFIGFNEKLMYLRQLFGGDAAAYDETLNQINTMNSIVEAEAYLSVVGGEYKWNKDNEPVAIFLQTVKRRFS